MHHLLFLFSCRTELKNVHHSLSKPLDPHWMILLVTSLQQSKQLKPVDMHHRHPESLLFCSLSYSVLCFHLNYQESFFCHVCLKKSDSVCKKSNVCNGFNILFVVCLIFFSGWKYENQLSPLVLRRNKLIK